MEHFCWQLLSVYLDQQPQPFKKMQAMHTLLCSIVFYLLTSCNQDDHTLISIQKLAKEAGLKDNSDICTVYEVLLTEEGVFTEEIDYVYYYKCFRYLDSKYETVPVLQTALEAFAENPVKFPKGNTTKKQVIMKEQIRKKIHKK